MEAVTAAGGEVKIKAEAGKSGTGRMDRDSYVIRVENSLFAEQHLGETQQQDISPFSV